MSDSKNLTTKQVARLCRVSDATVKRWEDAGALRSERTTGGHRRFRVEEVARFQREQNLGVKQNHADDCMLRAVAATHFAVAENAWSPLFEALVSGREQTAAAILINAFLQREPLIEIFDKLIVGAMRRIGELWFDGELTIAQEHLATRTILSAVHKLRANLPAAPPTGNLAVCCALEGDQHELPVNLVQIVLENRGWEVLNFGANLPLYSFSEEIERQLPELICIGATMIYDLDRAARDYQEFRQKLGKFNARIVGGGRAFDDERTHVRFPADLRAASFTQLAQFADEIAKSKTAE